MSSPRRPHLKSIVPAPTGPRSAEPAAPRTAVGVPKGVAEGVPIAVRPDPPRGDGRYPVAWLHIAAPKGAIGHRKALALIDDHAAHRDACPLRTSQEGRTAA